MMINWAEKQAPEDRQTARTYWTRNDTIRGWGAREALSSRGRARATGQPKVIASGDHVARGRLGRSQEAAETKGELSREDVHNDISQGMQDYLHTRMARSCVDSQRSVARRTLRAAPARQSSGGFSVRRRPTGKIKTKKRQGRAPPSAALLAFWLSLIRSANRRNRRQVRRPTGQAGGTAWQNWATMV